MARKKINRKSTKPPNPRKARRRDQRRAFRRRFKTFFDGEIDSDLDYFDNGLEEILEPQTGDNEE